MAQKNKSSEKLKELGKKIVNDIDKNKNPNLDVPIRALSKIASILKKELLDTGKHEHLRGVFYIAKRTIPETNINLVDDQTESDKIIEDLEVITGLSREQLHVSANKMGSMVG